MKLERVPVRNAKAGIGDLESRAPAPPGRTQSLWTAVPVGVTFILLLDARRRD